MENNITFTYNKRNIIVDNEVHERKLVTNYSLFNKKNAKKLLIKKKTKLFKEKRFGVFELWGFSGESDSG